MFVNVKDQQAKLLLRKKKNNAVNDPNSHGCKESCSNAATIVSLHVAHCLL